jgi:hypothetical protein
MKTRHDRLDEAIDQVAARLTEVTASAGLAQRIAASLPDRSPWLLYSWIPRLAITAMLAAGVSFVVLRRFDDRSTYVLRTFGVRSTDVQFAVAVSEHRTNVEPALIVRRTIVEPPQNDRRTTADHERSLEAIVTPAALALGTVAPRDLPAQGSLGVEPLAIADLPLTAETISPR